MSRSGGSQRIKNDFWAEKAKMEGYPARSVYKLEEILLKIGGIKVQSLVLDLGASPGSWSLYLMRRYQARVVACDIKPLSQKILLDKRINFIQGDFFHDSILDQIRIYGPYEGVVCDAAPSTSGSRLVDCARSYDLACHAFRVAQSCLSSDGLFVTKIFSGGEEQVLIDMLKSCFKSFKIIRPKAVRSQSFEIYLVGKNFLQC